MGPSVSGWLWCYGTLVSGDGPLGGGLGGGGLPLGKGPKGCALSLLLTLPTPRLEGLTLRLPGPRAPASQQVCSASIMCHTHRHTPLLPHTLALSSSLIYSMSIFTEHYTLQLRNDCKSNSE